MSSAFAGDADAGASAEDGGDRLGLRLVGGEVGEIGPQGVVDLAGDVAFEAADDFALGFPFAGSPGRVVAGARAAAQPADCDEVERAVGLAITAVVEPVAACLA